MTKKPQIAILTTARSDFGPLKRVIRLAANHFGVDLLVSGSHFLSSRGNSYEEIWNEFNQCENLKLTLFNSMIDDDSASGQVNTIAQTQLKASKWFSTNRCDLLLFLGDRWELWGVTLPAFLHGIPLAHISGGEVTEGVIDDSVRHSHTKIASLHFAATNEFALNISRMGEEDWRICVVGECGLDLVHDSEMDSKAEVYNNFKIDLDHPTILVTFHPSTLDHEVVAHKQIDPILKALTKFSQYQIVFTAPGVEQGSEEILIRIQEFCASQHNSLLINHLGSRGYLAVLRHSLAVIGNSSSGLLEAPSLGVPCINVGNRQGQRLAAASVQHVGYETSEIVKAIEIAVTPEFRMFTQNCANPYDPYGDGKNSLRIVMAIKNALSNFSSETLRFKKFNNIVYTESWNSLLLSGAT